MSEEGQVTLTQAAVDAALGEVVSRRGKGALGHDGCATGTRSGHCARIRGNQGRRRIELGSELTEWDPK